MPSLAGALMAFAEPVTIAAPPSTSYDDGGNSVIVRSDPVGAKAVIQPVSGRALLDLPEGIRDSASIIGWTSSEVALGSEIVYGGETFRVIFTWPRSTFVKFSATRVDGDQ